jgi:hypothetical protein
MADAKWTELTRRQATEYSHVLYAPIQGQTPYKKQFKFGLVVVHLYGIQVFCPIPKNDESEWYDWRFERPHLTTQTTQMFDYLLDRLPSAEGKITQILEKLPFEYLGFA